MPDIDPRTARHKLDIDLKDKPVKQRSRRMALDRCIRVIEEVDTFLSVGFIMPVEYPSWVLNIVTVPKKNGKIRVCIYFTNLNKACPMHPYPLSRINDLVDATTCF